jgi:hypothetical protein
LTDGLSPWPGNPIEFITALCLGSLTILGLGFPGRGARVTVPPVVNPNPIFNTDPSTLQSLSNPAAMPIGVGSLIPARFISSFALLAPFEIRNVFHTPGNLRAVSAALCAPSGGSRKISGFATRL